MRPPRPDFDWTRLNDGEMPLEELQRIDVAVSRPVDEYGGAAADQVATGYDGLGLIPAGLRMLWVRLTSLYTAEGPLALYNFEQVVFDNNVPVTVEGGVTSVALETSGNDGLLTSDVDPDGVGTIVQVWPSEDSLNGAQGEKWRFFSGQGGTGDTTYVDQTFNYYGTNVVNVYDNYNWTIYDGGTWYVGGPGYFIVEAPFKVYGGLWLNYRDHDFAGAFQVDDLGIDVDDPQRVVLRITIDQNCKLTGLVATPDSGAGQVVVIVNTDPTFTLTLASMNFASAGGNRIACPGLVDLDLTPGSSAMLWYDPFVSVWRVVGFCCGTGTGGGGGGPLGPGGSSVQWLHQPDRWYYGGHPPDVLTSSFALVSTTILYAFPFLCGAGGTVDDIGIQIGSAVAGGNVHLGIYSNKAEDDLRPDAKLYDSGLLSTAASVYIRVGGGVNITFDPDTLYWLVMQCSSNTIQPRAASANDAWPILGSNTTTPGGPQGIGWTATQAFGALPGSWPTTTSVYTPNNSTGLLLIGVLFHPVNTGGTGGGGGGGPIGSTTPTTLTGILQGDGSVIGTVTIGAGLSYSGGTLSVTGAGTGSVTSVATGTGLTGGPITTTGTVSLANTAVAAGSYGDSTHVATFTVDAQGRLTAAGTAAISAGAGYTDEQAQDAVANALANSLRIQWTYNDTLNQISADVFNYSITDTQLRYAAGTSVIGRAAGGASGPVADIAATADGQVLTRVAGALTWAVPATGGTGTVTSVAATAPAAGLTISGSPITTSGTLTFALADDLAALEALSGTNTIYYRSAANTWSPVSMGNGLSFPGGGLLSVPAMMPAGASHAAGLPPDTSATAHPNQPRLLGDSAVWVRHSGKILGANYTAAYQATTSGTFVGLTTPQVLTFTLDEAASVLIAGACAYYNSTNAGGLGQIAADVDGTDYTMGTQRADAINGVAGIAGFAVVSLAAGAHTVTLQFREAGPAGSTANFGERTIAVHLI